MTPGNAVTSGKSIYSPKMKDTLKDTGHSELFKWTLPTAQDMPKASKHTETKQSPKHGVAKNIKNDG